MITLRHFYLQLNTNYSTKQKISPPHPLGGVPQRSSEGRGGAEVSLEKQIPILYTVIKNPPIPLIFNYQPHQMNLQLTTTTKIILVIAAAIFSIIGFMVKLPSTFRHIDKELHTAFYFLAAAFLNILFANNKLTLHLLIFLVLLLFGVSIEYAQEYSNKLLHVRIHGRFDIEDVKANVKGLIGFSVLWGLVVGGGFVFKKKTE